MTSRRLSTIDTGKGCAIPGALRRTASIRASSQACVKDLGNDLVSTIVDSLGMNVRIFPKPLS